MISTLVNATSSQTATIIFQRGPLGLLVFAWMLLTVILICSCAEGK